MARPIITRIISRSDKTIDLSSLGLLYQDIEEIVKLIEEKSTDENIILLLDHNNLDDRSLNYLAKLTKVKRLNLDKTDIRGDKHSLIHLLQNNNITELSFVGCTLCNVALKDMIKHTKQYWINVVTDDERKKLIKEKLEQNRNKHKNIKSAQSNV